MPSLENLEAEVRGRLGDPSEAELPSEQIARAIQGALREFSRFYPETQEVALTLVAGQSDYPLPQGTLEVEEHGTHERSPFYYDHEYEWDFPVYDPRHNPDAYDYWRRVHDDYTRRGELELELQVLEGDPPLLRVFPTPDIERPLVVVVEKMRDLSSISPRDREGVVQWAQGDCLEYIGRKRSKSVTDIPTATGRLRLSDGADLRQEGGALKSKQEIRWGACATVVSGG